MESIIGRIYSRHEVSTISGVPFEVACLAFIGVVSIVKTVADSAYQLGRESKEIEMKRGFRKYMKNQQKMGSK